MLWIIESACVLFRDWGRSLWQDRRRPDAKRKNPIMLEEFCLLDPSHLSTPRGWQSEQSSKTRTFTKRTKASPAPALIWTHTHLPVWCPSGKQHAALSLSKSLAVNLLGPMGAKWQAHTHMCTQTHSLSHSASVLKLTRWCESLWAESVDGGLGWWRFWNSICSPLLPLCTPLTRNVSW